jgi:dipeptidase D
MDPKTRTIIDYFEQVNRIPRCSKNEQRICRWLQKWAEGRGLAYETDAANNLVIQVPASPEYEQAPIVVLQGHMDMVCEKRVDSDHDFSADPIPLVQDGHWLTARETTLGADNGIAIAMALALVDDPEVGHPPLELLFTVDEETGLTGALKLDQSLLKGRTLVNMDSEDEGVFVVGCAGGRTITIEWPLNFQVPDNGYEKLRISVNGMQGGHSGIDIAKHRANANKVMARLLNAGRSAGNTRLMDVDGGTGVNIIPRTCEALVACLPGQVPAVKQAITETAAIVKEEYRQTDPDLSITIEDGGPVEADRRLVAEDDSERVVNLLTVLPSGPVEMTVDFPLLVQTSTNLAMVKFETDTLKVVSSQRSSVPSRLDAICMAVEAAGRLVGAQVKTNRGYPSWPMDQHSPLLERCRTIFREVFGVEPVVQIMHAGLECGVIGERFPGMDMISLGPTVENPHSPSERLYLPSVEKVWKLMAALLESFKN